MTSAVDVQQAIDGSPAMYCAVAWQGSMLGGFAGLCLETVSETGPSTAVWIGAHASMAKVAETMIRGMGATGFIGFDFMLEKATGKDYLLECNPRPIQVGHLGARIGVDLAGLLAAAIAGRSPTIGPVVAPVGDLKALLFPHALRSKSRHVDALLDIPWNDAGLLRFAGYDQRLTANSTVSPSSQVRRCTLTERPAF